MSLYPELDNLNLDELIARLQSPSPEGEEYAAGYYFEVTLEIRKRGKTGNVFLMKQLDQVEPERLRAVIFALSFPYEKARSRMQPHGEQDQDELRKRLCMFLADDRQFIVAEAIDGLQWIGEEAAIDQVLALREHPSPYVRGGVLRYLARLYPDQALSHLIEALQDAHYIVRENAVDELGDLFAVQAILHLRPLLTDPHPHVRQATQTALEWLEDADTE